jgi:starvation-inducible outer membrane lipoprotein
MFKKLFTLWCWSAIVFLLSTAVFTQEAPEAKTGKEVRWEGNVIRSDPDQSTLTVRKVSSNAEMTIHYDKSTRWVSQEHGSKKVNDIDPTQVKDGDRVIVKGTYEKHVLHAALISKRLSHSQ